MAKIRGWAATGAGKPLTPYEYDPGPLGADEVEVAVEHCGVCHSDLSVINNEWGNAKYPFVPGHEAVGRVVALGSQAKDKGLEIGTRVGVGWTAASCMHCRLCLSGDQHMCPEAIATIIGHQGGFAERLRAHWAWAVPLPASLDATSAGPLMCGGITVFNPLARFGVKPTQRVGIVGIGGLGHLGVKFAAAWGCEVTAFTSSAAKMDEAKGFGARHAVSSRDSKAIKALAGTLDMLLITANATLDWRGLIATLAPKGRMHVVGAVLEPIPVSAFDLIGKERNVSGSPTGAPVDIATMLDFASRHGIAPQVEHFPMSKVNDALARLEAGKARYRIVLDADF
jgi:alcohol/geraniol dehydrogenase (NADP+)